jgi:hypothetical protein
MISYIIVPEMISYIALSVIMLILYYRPRNDILYRIVCHHVDFCNMVPYTFWGVFRVFLRRSTGRHYWNCHVRLRDF